MEPKITELIPAQNFEIIGKRLGAILYVELNYQASLVSPPGSAPSIYYNRIAPFDETDCPAINVSFAGGSYDNKDVTSIDGNYLYNLDVWTEGKTIGDMRGDELAAAKRDAIMGKCRAVLENPVYSTLDYDPPYTCKVGFSAIQLPDPLEGKSIANGTFGRMVFAVKATEGYQYPDFMEFAFGSTTVILKGTSKGYLWGTAAETAEALVLTEEGGDENIYLIAEGYGS